MNCCQQKYWLSHSITIVCSIIIALVGTSEQIFSQGISSTAVWQADSSFPKHGQFYARTANNTAAVQLSGTVYRSDFDSVYVLLARNDKPFKRFSVKLQAHTTSPAFIDDSFSIGAIPSNTDSVVARRFDVRFSIRADWCTYSFKLGFKSRQWDSVVAVRDSIVCGDVILICGQSNITCGNPIENPDELGRTFVDTNENVQATGINKKQRDFVWTTTKEAQTKLFYIGGIGFRLQQQIGTFQKLPLCIFNGGVGATTIDKHLPDNLDACNPSTIYGNLLQRAKQSGLDTSVQSLIWYQGESNIYDDSYVENFRTIYQAWMRDYPRLCKIYVVQIHASGCMDFPQGTLKEKQRRLQDNFPFVEVVASNAIPYHNGCHYADSGYVALGDRIYRLLARDLYNAPTDAQLTSPTLQSVFWLDSSKHQICLSFAPKGTRLSSTRDTILGNKCYAIEDAFLFDGKSDQIASVQSSGQDMVILTLKDDAQPNDFSHLSYASQSFYQDSKIVFQGPWIVNRRGVGALSFHEVPIRSAGIPK